MALISPQSFIANIQPDSIRVHPPTSVIFLCGGVIDTDNPTPQNLRHAFYLQSPALASSFEVVLAEKADPLTTDAGYGDLLSFESDIAQIVGLILLFAESPGSLAELGAFAALETIAPSLLAVLEDNYYNKRSFIRNGPIKFLENKYGNDWVYSLDREEHLLNGSTGIAGIDVKILMAGLVPVILKRLKQKSIWTKLASNHAGHAILLMTGLCQELGALTLTEIEAYLSHFLKVETRLRNYIYCAELLGWIRTVRKGNQNYYVATSNPSAIDYKLLPDTPTKDKLRWRASLREYWRNNERPRHRAITDVALSSQTSSPENFAETSVPA